MATRPNPVEALVTLPRLADAADRRANWRQAIAALGRSTRVAGPPPLDDIPPEQLSASTRTALAEGLVDDMDWIAPAAAAVALYELTTALPQGQERREFGRRVFARLYEGTAATFSAVGTRMALGGGKPLEAPTMRARVGLVLDLSVGAAVHADPLALALISRRNLFEQWGSKPSIGALPARRLAALLLERAAREAVRRWLEGDPHAHGLFSGDEVKTVHDRLLADREPLVWRHAAVARGLLAAVDEERRSDLEMALDPGLSPTEWRRAAVSLVTLIAYDPEIALKQCEQLLQSEIAGIDPGIKATMTWGLPRVIEAEPEAAELLLTIIAESRRSDVAEATASLLREVGNPDFGRDAVATLWSAVSMRGGSEEAMQAIFEGALGRPGEAVADAGVYGNVRRAVVAFESTGAREAYELALETVAAAHRVMDGVEALSSHSPEDPDLIALLVDLDTSILERSRLADLLLLGRRPGDSDTSIPELERLYGRLGEWLIGSEERVTDGAWTRERSTARQRRLRALLHLMDVEAVSRGEGAETASRVRERARRAVNVLLERISEGPDASVHRILCATLSRSFDAAVRESVADPSDVFLVAAHVLVDGESVSAVAEGSTTPEVSSALAVYADFLRHSSRETMSSIAEGSFDAATITKDFQPGDEIEVARRFVKLSQGIGTGGSYRGEALRQVVLSMGRALEAISLSRGLTELVNIRGSDADPLGDLEQSIENYRKLHSGATRRLVGDDVGGIDIVASVAKLSALVERAVSTGVPANAHQFAMAVGETTADLPDPMSAAIAQVLGRVVTLPTEAASDVYAIPLAQPRTALPDWLLPRRVIGGFYVVRSLGAGGAASVFVARRVEERTNTKADSFALKVPQYDPSTARSLSEQEFMAMFRQEAGALLQLPSHENLANFVTFDLAARPKPILVMELVKGLALDRVIRNRSLTLEASFDYLDGVLRGLEAMHAVGVGHLDVKPSNVILQNGKTPVLVDFGLSGRHLRPGCGTLEYTAPEVLGVVPEGYEPTPMPADIYAFGCMAFELLTGQLLLDGDETRLISLHISHDGWPTKLAQLAENGELLDLATVLAACLRHDARNRPTVEETREALARAAQSLAGSDWPLRTSASAADLSA